MTNNIKEGEIVEKLKWYQVRETDVFYKFGIIWLYPKKYPFWKYLLPFVSVVK